MNDEYADSGYNPNSEFIDGIDLECDEDLSMDYHEELGQMEEPSKPMRPHRPDNRPTRQAKIKPMPQSYIKAFPNVQSMLITRFDGRQVLFVRSR